MPNKKKQKKVTIKTFFKYLSAVFNDLLVVN